MVFGLEEQDSKILLNNVQQLFTKIKEKPQFEETSVGKNKSKAARPVEVKCRSGAAVAQILRKGAGLKCLERFQRVFVCPDSVKSSGNCLLSFEVKYLMILTSLTSSGT